MKNIFAYTAPGSNYPETLSINEQDDGSVTIDVRAPASAHGSCGDVVRMSIPQEQLLNLAEAINAKV